MAERYADWTTLGAQARVQVFRDALPSGPARAVALQPFDVIVAMRERTPFPAELIQALPALRLLVTTGMRNNAIDMQGRWTEWRGSRSSCNVIGEGGAVHCGFLGACFLARHSAIAASALARGSASERTRPPAADEFGPPCAW